MQRLAAPVDDTGMTAIPYLTVGEFGEETNYNPPPDEFIRRFLYHITEEAFRGTDLKSKGVSNYSETWKAATQKEKEPPNITMWLPRANSYAVYSSIPEKERHDHHLGLEKGEKVRINSLITMTATTMTKHHNKVPLCPKLRSSLKERLPMEANAHELDLAQKLIRSNLAETSRKSMDTARRALQRLLPERDIFNNPEPEDKGLLLLRLSTKKLAPSTKLQYMKWYSCIFRDSGREPPPSTPLYNRLVGGLSKLQLDPRKAQKKKKRAAYSVQTLRMVGHALAQMKKAKNPWGPIKTQAIFTAVLIAFWACARTADLCGAKPKHYSKKTTLLERDVTCMMKGTEVEGLQLFFKAEKVPKKDGSFVQLPMVKNGPLTDLCPVAAYLRYQELKNTLAPHRKAPWLIGDNGKPITQSQFLKAIEQALKTTYEGTKHAPLMKTLKGHSLRAGLPSHMQEMASVLTEDERRLMGRWLSEAAHKLYCKNKAKARFKVAKKVIRHY